MGKTTKNQIVIAEIRRQLRTKTLGNLISYYPTIDSTNDQLKRAAAEDAPAGMIIIAEEQTTGRGRFSRSFYSPPGSGIYMSVLLRPDFDPEKAVLLTAAAAVCVAQAIEALSSCAVKIKWVNDLYVDGKKICGILTEAAMDPISRRLEYAVIGIGINLSTDGFPKELREIAGGIQRNGKAPNRNKLIAEILNRLETLLTEFDEERFLPEYRARSLVLGKEVRVLHDDTEEDGTALEIDNKARLVVRMTNGEIRRLHSGEISCRVEG